MLALTKKTDYALIALSHLAKRPERVISAREIAGEYDLPLPILTNILKTLAQASILVSARGASGGYGLARPAESITLHELIAAIEGPLEFVRCVLSKPEPVGSLCDLAPSCPIRLPAQRIRDRLRTFLEDVTLAELISHEVASTDGPGEATESSRPFVKEFA